MGIHINAAMLRLRDNIKKWQHIIPARLPTILTYTLTRFIRYAIASGQSFSLFLKHEPGSDGSYHLPAVAYKFTDA